MNLYESEPHTLDEQIEVWENIRKQNILLFYGRKEGFKNFGLQPIPSLAVSEYKAKEAIQQVILLKSLKNSAYAREEWSLVDTSAELIHTPPRNTFKKQPYIVEVHYDNNPQNAFPYTNWDVLYVQDEHDNWFKTEGKVDVNGLFYEDLNGDNPGEGDEDCRNSIGRYLLDKWAGDIISYQEQVLHDLSDLQKRLGIPQ